MKKEIKRRDVARFLSALDDLSVQTIAVLLAVSGLRKCEVWGLHRSDIDKKLGCIIPVCHTGETKHSGISFYNVEVDRILEEYDKTTRANSEQLFIIGHERFLAVWKQARLKTGLNLKPKDLRDFFSQEMGKALIRDRYVDIFQGRAPKGVLAKHYSPLGIRVIREIYDGQI